MATDKTIADIYEERLIPVEDMKLAVFERQLELLDKELEAKQKLGFKKIQPTYEFENAPEYLELQKEIYANAIEQEKISIQQQINNILNDRDQRRLEKERLNKTE